MTSFARTRTSLRRAAFVAALGALMAPAGAGASVHAQAAAKKKKAKLPVVTSVAPDVVLPSVKTLEIRGKHFIRGRYKNSVEFKRDRGPRRLRQGEGRHNQAAARLPCRGSSRRNSRRSTASSIPTRFRVRVLTKKLGKRFTKLQQVRPW